MANTRSPVLLMETDKNQVAGGGSTGGWVSGTTANLAASAGVTVCFDLGPDWDQYPTASLSIYPIAPSSGLINVTLYGSDTATVNQARRIGAPFPAGASFTQFFATLSSANGCAQALIRPMGRYVLVNLTNGDATNALGATSKCTLCAYPN